jgi:tRNA (cmo5U34)-methyltransferase
MSEFDKKAGDWDKNKMHHDRSLAIASELLHKIELRPESRGLEFGAGTGLLSFVLRDKFSEITLMDNSAEMLRVASEKINHEGITNMHTRLFDLEKDSPNGDPFDLVMNQMVLHHISDIPDMIGKFYALTKPGGSLAIADLYTEDGSFHGGITNVHFGFDPEVLARTCIEAGFSHVEHAPCFIIKREGMHGKLEEYPLFLLIAKKS